MFLKLKIFKQISSCSKIPCTTEELACLEILAATSVQLVGKVDGHFVIFLCQLGVLGVRSIQGAQTIALLTHLLGQGIEVNLQGHIGSFTSWWAGFRMGSERNTATKEPEGKWNCERMLFLNRSRGEGGEKG